MANQCSGSWSIQVTNVLNLLFKGPHNQTISKAIVKTNTEFQTNLPTMPKWVFPYLAKLVYSAPPSTLAHSFLSQHPDTVPPCCCPFLCLCPLLNFFQDQFSTPLLSKLSPDWFSSHVEGKIQRRNCLCSLHPTTCSTQDRYALNQVRRTWVL